MSMKKLISDLHKNGKTIHEIAEMLGMDPETVQEVLNIQQAIEEKKIQAMEAVAPRNIEFEAHLTPEGLIAIETMRKIAAFGESKKSQREAINYLRRVGYLK